jgi:acyl carrier protein phosphodiesterase
LSGKDSDFRHTSKKPMNHLAHIHLSRLRPDLLGGNFIADFLSYEEKKHVTPSLARGIQWHKWIDAYTDHHPLVLEQKKRMYPVFGKYSAVLLDLLMDYQLARFWYLFDDRDFQTACGHAYDLLQNQLDFFPKETGRRIQNMIEARWLHTFQTPEGFGHTLTLLARRTKFADDFSGLLPFYSDHLVFFDQSFCEFYPELDGYAQLRAEELI